MADMGDCGVCRKRGNRTYRCKACDVKMCTACRTKARGKCPACGKAASITSN